MRATGTGNRAVSSAPGWPRNETARMDLETVSSEDFGRSLTGTGVNLLTRDVRGLAGVHAQVFGPAIRKA